MNGSIHHQLQAIAAAMLVVAVGCADSLWAQCATCTPKSGSGAALAICFDQANPDLVVASSVVGSLGQLQPVNLKNRRHRLDLPIGESIEVQVCNTDTALFSHAVKKTDVELKLPEEALQTFLTGFGPYGSMILRSAAGVAQVASLKQRLRGGPTIAPPGCVLSASDVQIIDTGSSVADLAETTIGQIDGTLSSLPGIALAAHGVITKGFADRRSDLQPYVVQAPPANEWRLQAYADLERVLAQVGMLTGRARVARTQLEALSRGLRAQPACSTLVDEIDALAVGLGDSIDALSSVVADAPKGLQAALSVETMVLNLYLSEPTWTDPDPFDVRWLVGKKIAITVKRKEDPALARANPTLKPFEREITVHPDRLFRPAAGLTLAYADDAVFQTFTTKTLADKTLEVVEKDLDDRRATYALTLSTTWRGLDWTKKNGVALWLPELHVGPSDKDLRLGLGIGVSWKRLKLSAGHMWIRHQVLRDPNVEVGSILPADSTLRLRDSYGDSHFFVGLSVIGWKPFK
jgi:hypothetical protein